MTDAPGSERAAERWENVRRLFHDALERPAGEERAGFLDSACANDPELRAEVESLLASHERAGSFLESPILDAETGAAVLAGGTRLGPYEITTLLGVGGMGEIYRARDTRLSRDVAIKVLPAGLARNPERLSRFEQEARAASALNHPHIVALYDVGKERGLAYIVTELLEGQTLAERIAQGPVGVRKALDYAVQAARGLAAAHERGIVHRDVKPANLFVTGDGQLKILDFGLAKLADPASGVPAGGAAPPTTPGLAMGTVGYMSPEQVRGEATDFRSDQFSLGCVLYELLAGEAPFRRPTGAQTMAAVIEDEPPPVQERNPRVSEPVAWILERCLAKEPAERYAATRDLARELEHAARRPSETRPALAKGGPKPRPRTFPLLALAAALIALGAVAWWGWSRPRPVPVVRFLTYSGHDSSPSASPDGRTVVFSSTRDGRQRLWLKQLATGNEVPLTGGPDDNPRFSPDGSQLLFARTLGSRVSLYRVPVVGGEPRKLLDDSLYGDFAPDGRRICFVRQFLGPGGELTSVVGTADLDGGRVRELNRFPDSALVHPRWSPDGRTVALGQNPLQAGEPTRIALVDAETGAVRRMAPTEVGISWGGLVWTGAHKVAYAQPESAVGVQTGTSSRIVVQDVRSTKGRVVFWSPANTRMLDVLGPGRLVLESRALRENLREFALRSAGPAPGGHWLSRGNSADRQPSYSPDGEWIVFSSNRAGNLDLWAVSRSSGAVHRLTDDAAQDWDPGFTRDGKLLWSANRTGRFEVWTADADGTHARQLTRDGVDAENPAATPDGRWILYASSNPRLRGIVRVRRDGSEPVRLVPGNVILPEVSPDGRYVAFVANQGSERGALRVARTDDGALTRFEFRLPAWTPGGSIDLGRSRWFPDGRAIAFIGREPNGAHALYVQEFRPDADTGGTRRLLVPPDPEFAAESLAISPDGEHLTVAYVDQLFNLMIAENVPGVERPRRAAAE